MSIRFFGAYARVDGAIVPHEVEIIGAHLYEVFWGYDIDGEFQVDGAYQIQAFTEKEARTIAEELHAERGDEYARMGDTIRIAMW